MKLAFNQILQEKLGEANLSEVSRKTGIPKSILHDWVGSKRMPSAKNLSYVRILATFLGISLEELLFGERECKKTISIVSFEDAGRKYQINIERIK